MAPGVVICEYSIRILQGVRVEWVKVFFEIT